MGVGSGGSRKRGSIPYYRGVGSRGSIPYYRGVESGGSGGLVYLTTGVGYTCRKWG